MTPVLRPGAAPRPPRAARVLLRVLLDRRAREVVVGDLDEEFHEVCRRSGVAAARRMYWRLAVGSAGARWLALLSADGSPEPRRRTLMDLLIQDVRDGLRQLRAAPATTAAAAITLALGIAATTIIFGVINALTLRPLAYEQPDRVTFVLAVDAESGDLLFNMRYRDAVDVADAGAFADLAVYRAVNANLTGGELPERAQGYAVSAGTFTLLGVEAAVGRVFTEADAGLPVVVLGHGLWSSRFAADPAVVGRTIGINGEMRTVIGVMPRAFEFPVFNFKGDLWMPLEITPAWRSVDRGSSPSVVAIARLADGVTVEAAQASVDAVMAAAAAEAPASNAGRGARVVPMAQLGNEQVGPVFTLLGAAAVLVLVVACANVANLLLGRAAARRRELAVRAAMGAGRARLLRQLLVESLLLAMAGGVLAIGLTWIGLEAVRGALPDFVRRVLPGVDAVRVDPAALGVAAGCSLVAVVFFGLLPAWQAASTRAADALRVGSRAMGGGVRRWLRPSLVTAEVALSTALLVVAALLARSVHELAGADAGFDRDRVLAMTVSLPESTYPDQAVRQAYFDRVVERVRGVTGVEAASLIFPLPFSTSDASLTFGVEGTATPGTGPDRARLRTVSPGYFQTMGIPVVAGRVFDGFDGLDRQTAIVNETFARRYLPDGPPVGRRLSAGDPVTILDVVGVVGDVRHWSLGDAPEAEVYLPLAATGRRTMTLAVRTAGAPAAHAGAVRGALADIDPTIAPFDVGPLSALVGNSYLAQTAASSTIRVLSLGALVLAAIGLYGVLAHAVGQRTREFGVRLALGATRRDVLRLVLRQSLTWIGVGLAAGLGLAAFAARAAGALLFGVGPLDLASYVGAAAVLVMVGLAASWLPARRAVSVDPATSLRVD